MAAPPTSAVAFPLSLDADGRTRAAADHRAAVEQLIRQLVFTRQGERLNQPDLGCGLQALVFSADSDDLVATTQFLVASELQRWLGDVIRVTGVDVGRAVAEGELDVRVTYALAGSVDTYTVLVSR